ncbi:MAG TPA: group I intron-associated PD-(D/E)XK endonuclease [Solirubrobacterales bacterium]|jgi:hypothetical protein
MARRGSGNRAEAAILAALVNRGFDVLVPFGEGQPYDLAVDLVGAGCLKVQCKTAWRNGGCMRFNTRTTDHGRGRLSYEGHADIFGVYFPPTEDIYLVPLDAVASTSGWLRLEPTRNNQKRRIRMAEQYELARWTRDALCEVAEGASRERVALADVA